MNNTEYPDRRKELFYSVNHDNKGVLLMIINNCFLQYLTKQVPGGRRAIVSATNRWFIVKIIYNPDMLQ